MEKLMSTKDLKRCHCCGQFIGRVFVTKRSRLIGPKKRYCMMCWGIIMVLNDMAKKGELKCTDSKEQQAKQAAKQLLRNEAAVVRVK